MATAYSTPGTASVHSIGTYCAQEPPTIFNNSGSDCPIVFPFEIYFEQGQAALTASIAKDTNGSCSRWGRSSIYFVMTVFVWAIVTPSGGQNFTFGAKSSAKPNK